ncbi:hypothetical protein [Megasphaera elsdenii]|uniref:hypothetical protein n=1 Tax=Megasphaera elsdenii TaxID=907 RepID=UPI00242BFEDA|nr:hypothetical protein [Megasphaera elsdenii]
MKYSTPSQLRAARVMLTVLWLTGACGISVQAESAGGETIQTKPITIEKTGQTVTDDFDVKNGSNRAVLEIASSAAANADGVTEVNSKNIKGIFTVGGIYTGDKEKDNVVEANGIWVQDDYPGKVKLADGTMAVSLGNP